MADRISSLDDGYQIGDLSVFPDAIDDKTILYESKNNAETTLKHTLSYIAKQIIVESTDSFPTQGLIRIGPKPGSSGNAEIIYYGSKTATIFKDLVRGFAGSLRNQFPVGASVSNAVMAEHHNAIKDAVFNIEETIGLRINPDENSINGILRKLENRFLSPKASFRAYPTEGPPPLQVRFQNFSEGDAIRFLWDFGDGITSIEKNPTHTYRSEGVYTVKLNIITTNGAQSVTTKSNYITISNKAINPFFYAELYDGSTVYAPSTYQFVDQTDGDIIERIWVFGDGETERVTDPDIHTVIHTYEEPGDYTPSLLVVFSSQLLKRVFLTENISVLE